ncbi:MAG: hypothetical protein QM628_00250 [Propionicimonas sp.]
MPQGFEWIVLLLLIVVAPVVLIVWFSTRSSRRRKADEAARAAIDPKGTLDALFAGSPSATYVLSPAALPFEVVVAGAAERGYRLAGQNGPTLVFARN